MNKKRLLFIVLGLVSLLVSAPSGCASTSTPAQTPKQPIEVISVLYTQQPGQTVNPGGPPIEITLKNVSDEPVVSLSVTLDEGRPVDYPFDFGVTSSNPLSPGESISSERILIGGGWGGGIKYSLKISGTMQSGNTFNFIWEPAI